MPASEVYVDNGILMITPSSTNPMITERKLWNVFRTCGRDDQQGGVAGKYIAEHLKDKKVAIVHDKTTYGKGLADETKKAMNNLGVHGGAVRRRQRRREGFRRARLQDQERRRRGAVLGRRAYRRRPGAAPDARSGPERRVHVAATASPATSSPPSPAPAPRAR